MDVLYPLLLLSICLHVASHWHPHIIRLIAFELSADKFLQALYKTYQFTLVSGSFPFFTPDKDTRSGYKKAKSRDGREFESITVKKATDIIDHLNETKKNIQVVAIDEAQFFDNELSNVCNYLANNNYIVLVAGLDMDFDGKPFESLVNLIATAERITKLKAICMECGAEASFSERLKGGKDKIQIGDIESYEARCRHCHSLSKHNPENYPKLKKAKI